MKGSDVLRTALQGTQMILSTYLSDLSDEEIAQRPAEGANTVAWQLGHLISSEQSLISTEIPHAGYPPLPDGFGENYTKETSSSDPTPGMLTKAEYLDLFNKTRQQTIELVTSLTDEQLDEATKGPLAQFAPTIGALCMLVSNHTLMHGGQVAVLRRQLDKPILM